MRITIAALVFVCAAAGCKGGPGGGNDGGPGLVDAPACDCHVEGDELTMTWGCFCAKFGCDDQLAPTRPACEGRRRTDYPECGLTWLKPAAVFGVSGWVFDASGQLVGETVVSDTSPYVCPSDPGLQANLARGGRFPEASCRAVECDPCYTGSFPCSWGDGGTRD